MGTNFYYPKIVPSNIAVLVGIDGYLCLIDTDKTEGKTYLFDAKTIVDKPKLLYQYKIGSSISTPIIISNKVIVSSYKKTYLFTINTQCKLELLDKIKIRCEATPVVHVGRIYIASRDSYLYCLGQKISNKSLH